MKRRFIQITIALSMLMIVLTSGEALRAETTVIQVTSNRYQDFLPHMKGAYLVWQGFDGRDWEIYLYNTMTKTTAQITDNDYDDISPQTDGHYIVWQGLGTGEWDIYLWEDGQTQPISDSSAEDVSPRIGGGLVVWASAPFGEDYVDPRDVILYEIAADSLTTLSESVDPGNNFDDDAPKIDGGEVVFWTQTDEQSEEEDDLDDVKRFVYDLAAGTVTENPEYVSRDNAKRDGSLRVLSRFDGHDKEIFIYHSELRTYYQVTDNDVEDRYPIIHGNAIAWMADGEIFVAAFRCLVPVSPAEGGILDRRGRPTFSWKSTGYTEFKVQISQNPDFPENATWRFPRYNGSSPSEGSYTLTMWEWWIVKWLERRNGCLHWRVTGTDVSGNTAFSDACSFTIEKRRRFFRPDPERD